MFHTRKGLSYSSSSSAVSQCCCCAHTAAMDDAAAAQRLLAACMGLLLCKVATRSAAHLVQRTAAVGLAGQQDKHPYLRVSALHLSLLADEGGLFGLLDAVGSMELGLLWAICRKPAGFWALGIAKTLVGLSADPGWHHGVMCMSRSLAVAGELDACLRPTLILTACKQRSSVLCGCCWQHLAFASGSSGVENVPTGTTVALVGAS
jgi:hypothetical protein